MRLWKTNIIKKPRNLCMPPVPAWSVKKQRKRNNRGIFRQCIFATLKESSESKNKPFIGLQLVVMWFIPLVRCPRAAPSGNARGSLCSWRYCVGARLKFWRRSRVPKKGSRDEAVFLAASPLVTAPPSNLTKVYYNSSAAKSHSTTTQYRQLRRRRTRGINNISPRFRPTTLTYSMVLIFCW